MDDPSYPVAPCSVCQREMRVKKDGTIGHHGGETTYHCSGVDKPPFSTEEIKEDQQ